MKIGMADFDTTMHEFESMHIEFSKLSLNEVYEIQQVRLRENVIAYQETKQQNKEKAWNSLVRDKEQEITTREKRRVSLAETIKNAIAVFHLKRARRIKIQQVRFPGCHALQWS